MRNLPNILSISRLLATIIIFILVLVNQPWTFLVATGLFFLASLTDFFDGYLARKLHVVSSLGVFLDLTADKIFVAALLIAMVQIEIVAGWIACIIITREIFVSGLRSMAAAKGKVIAARKWGKQKTFLTLIAIGGILLAKGLGAKTPSLFPLMLTFTNQTINSSDVLLLISNYVMILATLWTIFSGIEYIMGALPIIRTKQ